MEIICNKSFEFIQCFIEVMIYIKKYSFKILLKKSNHSSVKISYFTNYNNKKYKHLDHMKIFKRLKLLHKKLKLTETKVFSIQPN